VRRSLVYELTGGGAVNHAPARPTPTSPYDWYVYYSGNTAQLCAQANGDPDGDPITGYYFDVYESAQLWNSGWVGSNCVTTGPLGPYTYKWRVKVRDSGGAESDWSDSWHFTLVNPNLEITELYFEPQDGSSEQVKIRACTAGQGGVGITMRVSVNDASDGSGNGEWHIIKELGVPCFNAEDAPIWPTLEYGDGPHRVRAEAHGADASWDGAAVREEVYTLPHRRPAGPRLVAPVPPSGDIHEAITLNSRTVTFRWESTIRAGSYTLHISTNPSPKDDPNPVFRQTFAPSVTEYTLTLGQDYPILYWQVSAANDVGTNASGDQLFGIDRVAPSCTVQSLPGTTYESVFQVNWGGSDNLAGVRGFDIQYLDSERGTWNDWLTGVPAAKSYELFTGQPGHSYAFRCRATDNADNSGDYPSSPDTSIIVDPTARPQTPWWDTAYGEKRNLTILNNMPGTTLPAGYPVHLHFDSGTTPTAAELYNASQSSPKCNDLRLVYNDTTELDRVMQNCSSSAIDIWFRTQISIAAGTSDSTAHQLYYGNPSAGGPPGSPTTVFDPPLDANTVGLWYMDEGGGSTLHDYSAYNNHCSIDPTTTWVTPAKFSGALHFLGGTHGPTVNCGTSSTFNLQTFTFEMFLKRTGTAWGRLAGHLGDNQNRWLMTLNGNGTIRVSIWPCPTCGGEEFNGSMPIGDTVNWHHVAFSLQNSTLKIYVDGQLDSTHQVVWGNIRSGTPPLTLGSAENIERAFAEMSHVRLSNIARTSFPYGSSAAITNEPSLAAGDPVAPPITGSSDLAVLSLATYPNPGGGLLAEAIVQNQGDLSTQNGFYTDLYLDHLPTGAGDYTGSIQFWVNDPIAPAAVVTLTTVITDLPGLGGAGLSALHATGEITGTLYAQVDSTGGVGEPDEANNIYDAGTQVCVAPSDDYEPDDSASEATVLPLGASQSHNLSTLADQDWFEIDVAEAGREYVITTNDLDLNADTYLYLYDTDGTTLLAANDDYGGTLASQIAWTPTAPGTYYVVVKHWNPNVGGCGTTYTLSLIEGQSFQLNSGWNLVSYRVEPAVPDLPPVLSTIDGRYDRVLGETGVYAPDLPDAYNTLHELHAGLGYYLRVTDAVGPGLLVAGTTLPASSPIPLHEGWNWVGYLPPTTLPITAALQSIEGHYQRVLSLDEVYDPSLPEFSTLWKMEPGQGYLIYMTDSVSLVYPTGSGATARSALESGGPGCEAVSPTPFLTLVYGQIEVNGDPAPVGTRVEAITPREEVAGCFVVHHPGLFGLMHVYGEDATAEPPIAGFRAGEALAFRVNGAPADASTGVLWQDDRMPHTTVLSATVSIAPGGDIYLPLILKGE
jgi:hypothetical protein